MKGWELTTRTGSCQGWIGPDTRMIEGKERPDLRRERMLGLSLITLTPLLFCQVKQEVRFLQVFLGKPLSYEKCSSWKG